MEDEIDLRVYFSVLSRHKWVILGITLVAGLSMYIFSSLQPRVYEATALVMITRPLYQFQFTPNILNLGEKGSAQQFTGKAAVELADSDVLLGQALDSLGPLLKSQEHPLSVFRKKVKASTSPDPSIIKLKASDISPQVAATIANTTADLYVKYVNDLYGQSSAQEKFFDKQLAQAKSSLDKAEQALTEFQKRNVSSILRAELTARQSTLNNYLNLTESLGLLLQNVRSLHKQLASQPAGNLSTLGEDLAALGLQIAASATSGVPIQLQLPGPGGNLSSKTNGEQAIYLAELAKTISAKLAEIKKQTRAMPARILTLQGQLQKVNTESAQLTRQRDLAQTMFTSLAQKAGETRISSQDSSGRVRIASYASIPETPIGGRLQKTMIAFVLGFFLSIFSVFIIEYFRKPQTETPACV